MRSAVSVSMQRDDLRAWSAAWPEGRHAGNDGDDHDDAPASARLRFRTLWISDLHLGTPGCQAQALLDFLKHTECASLFLVGDIIDG